MIDGAACNAADQRLRAAPKTVTVGSGDEWLAVDQANGDVYVANTNDGTVSVSTGPGAMPPPVRHATPSHRPCSPVISPST